MSQSLHMRRNMENLSIEHETQHLTAISDNHSIQQSTEISDEEKSPANNDILSSWHSATNTLEDIEAIQCGIKKCCHMNIDTEKIMITGLRVKRKGRFSVDVIAALKNENLDNVAICNFYFDQTEGEYSLQPMYGDYEGQACFQFGNGEDCIIFHGIENALAWYQNDKDSDQYTYLIVFDWSQFPQLAGFISKFNDRYLVIDRTENTDNILRETESLSELNVIRLLHPTKNDGSWSAVKEGKFDIWRKELEEAEYGEVMEKSIDVNNDMKTDNAGECDQEQKDSPPENIDRETIDSENADEKEFPDKNGTTTMGITGIDEDLIDAESHQDFVTASTCDDESDNLDEQAIANPDTNETEDIDEEKPISEENDTNDQVQQDDFPEIVTQEINDVEDANGKEATDNDEGTTTDKIGDNRDSNFDNLSDTATDLTDEEKASIGDGKEVLDDDETAESEDNTCVKEGNFNPEDQKDIVSDSTDEEFSDIAVEGKVPDDHKTVESPIEAQVEGGIQDNAFAENMTDLARRHQEIVECTDQGKLEEYITTGIKKEFIGQLEAGAALSNILKHELFSPYKNFVDYCVTVFDFKKSTGYYYVNVYETYRDLSTIVEKVEQLKLITSGSQLRAIGSMQKEHQLKIFKKAVSELDGEQLTAKKINAVKGRFNKKTHQFNEAPNTEADEETPNIKPVQKKSSMSKKTVEAIHIQISNGIIVISLADPEIKKFFEELGEHVSNGNSVEIGYKKVNQK